MMFERYTDRARRIVVLAQEEARERNHNYIGTEHLLLGILREGESVAAKALDQLGVSPEAVSKRVAEIAGQGQHAVKGVIAWTPRAKKALELSLREALHLGHSYIGGEHLLLGVVREADGLGATILKELRGIKLEDARTKVIEIINSFLGSDVSDATQVTISVGGNSARIRLKPENRGAELEILSVEVVFKDQNGEIQRAKRWKPIEDPDTTESDDKKD